MFLHFQNQRVPADMVFLRTTEKNGKKETHLSEALHTGTETEFTGSGSPIRFQCGLAWAPHDTQTMRIAMLDWISRKGLTMKL